MKIYLAFAITFLVISSAVAAKEDKLAIIGTMQECQQAQIFYEKCMQKDSKTHDIFEKKSGSDY
ncbi:MAG: hypothetical protein WA173_07275 [Pseudomonas sp.]|uniref:hypothetical protein n=1 Tax=Pseudomonas sp. TaxID=306 RepID=UPI003BB7B681